MSFNQNCSDFLKGWMSSADAEYDKISVKRIYIDINDGNLYDGVLFSQIMYWHGNNLETGKPRMETFKDGHFWLAKTHKDWYAECRIREHQAKACIQRMCDRGLIIRTAHLFKGFRTSHIRVDPEALESAIRYSISDRSDIEYLTGQIANVQPITETTAKTTSKKTNKYKSVSSETLVAEKISSSSEKKPLPGVKTTPVEEKSNSSEQKKDQERTEPTILLKKKILSTDDRGWVRLPKHKDCELPVRIAVRRMQIVLALDCLENIEYREESGKGVVWCNKKIGDESPEDKFFSESEGQSLKQLRSYAIAARKIDKQSFNERMSELYGDSVDWCEDVGWEYACKTLESGSVLKEFNDLNG